MDGSEFSSKTLTMAGRVAPVFGVPLEVITCIGMSDYYLTSRFEQELTKFTSELEETARRMAEEAVDRAFAGNRPADLTVTVKFGEPAKVLVEESNDALMLIIGRHGGGGFLGAGDRFSQQGLRRPCPLSRTSGRGGRRAALIGLGPGQH
ncbi:universal stress protein [Paenarthrobacter ureafaciens]